MEKPGDPYEDEVDNAVDSLSSLLEPLIMVVPLLLLALVIWGGFVVADSPQFSALAAAACDRRDVGAALALMNSIGFGISIVSIELAVRYLPTTGAHIAWLLLPGPLLGLLLMRQTFGPVADRTE